MSNQNNSGVEKSLIDDETKDADGNHFESARRKEAELATEKRISEEKMKQKEIKENLKEKQDEIEKMKNIIEKIKGKTHSFSDAFTSVKQMLGDCNVELPIHTDANSSEKAVQRIEDEIRKCIDFLETKELSPAEVIENSTAVQGTFCTNNINDWIEPRRQIVNIRRTVGFRTSTLTQRDNLVKHESLSSSNIFDKAIEKSGWGLAVEVNAFHPIAGECFEYEGKSQEEKSSQRHGNVNMSYFCKTTYSVVPVKLWTPLLSDLSLCTEIVEDLKQIEHLITIKETIFAKQKVNDLFQIYGSHLYCGKIHFGGFFQVKTEFQSMNKSNKISIEDIVSKEHSAYLNACLKFFGIIQIEEDVSGNTRYISSKTEENHISSEQSKIHTSLNKLGGPIEMNSLGLWKKGLNQNNNNWVVVDGGKPKIVNDQMDPKDFVGLWKIIQNESSLFKDSTALSTFLLNSWLALSGLQIPQNNFEIERIFWHQSKINRFIEQSASGELSPESYCVIFETLSTIVHNSQTDTGKHSVWQDELTSNSTLHSLFERLLLIQFNDKEAIRTGLSLQKLLKEVNDVNFPQKAAVRDWMKKIGILKSAKIFNDYEINNIESFFEEIRRVAGLKNIVSNDKSARTYLTGEVATVITTLLKKFREEEGFTEYMVFLSFVVLLDFDVMECQFRVKLTSYVLFMCTNEIDKIYENLVKFKNTKSSDKILQAILIQKIIQGIYSATKNSEYLEQPRKVLITMRFSKIWKDIVQNFSSLIDPSILNAVKQSDVYEVLDTLNEIAAGQTHISQSDLSWIYVERFSTNLDVLQENEIQKGGTDTFICSADQDVDRNLVDILNTFGLEKYFPEKISMQLALAIHDNQSAKTNEVDLPWIILKKIISVNTDFREKVLKDFLNASVKSESCDDDLMSSSDEENNSPAANYHPSDVFLAIFQCCDPFLKRLIVTKLTLCQFAVPILFADFMNKDLVFSTWPMNDIVLHGEIETFLNKTRHSMSFIRVGKGLVQSKSKLINEFLRDLNKEHATFIHKDCPLGRNRRTISKGIVEMSWLVPDKKKSINQVITDGTSNTNIKAPLNIFNLRGDAQDFDKQLNLLLHLSNLMVVLISYDDLQQKQHRPLLQIIHSSNISVIILTNMTGCEHDISFLKNYRKEMGIDNARTKVIPTLERRTDVQCEANNRSSSYLKDKLTIKIIKLLEQNVGSKQTQINKINLPEGIRSDESRKCVIGKKLAESLFKECMIIETPEHRKDIILPLQGKSLWHEISKKEKDLKRSNIDVFDCEETIYKHIGKLRKKQTHTCNEAPDPFSIFVNTLVTYMKDVEVLQYFIIWFKQMINNQSRVLLNDLMQKFLNAFKNYESTKEIKEEDTNSKEELDQAEELLAEASFGIEHFFREIGQVYEAFIHSSEYLNCNLTSKTKTVLQRLPIIVAKLLLLGHPLEIMDGDAANVPQKWITTVLKEVQNIVGLNKKIVAVSVLGIQSSGKSTLLNTIFGLNFSVSAGRCTRGIYIQVVPIDNLRHIHADYMIVLDTEGLRAPERASEKVLHDNEIATFVVGLADIILLNLMGESIADMTNILEIVITGLLRLQQVNRSLTLRQSCMFIHQNVSNNAQLQLIKGNRNIVKHLDAMTKDVAIQQKIAYISHFADVIKFNPTEDIKYIPDLLHGSPEMGPVNQKYSAEVIRVLHCILNEKASCVRPLTFENYLLHLQSLWQGIQAEDFIFSFRNILEIKSYGILESEYQRLIWELEELKLEWMNNNIKPRLQYCQNSVSIAKSAESMIRECSEILDEKFEDFEKSLKDFVKTSELQEHMEHYLAEKCYTMQFKKNWFQQDAIQSINQEKEKCISKLAGDGLLLLKEKQITSAARELAKTFSGEKPRREKIDDEFQNIWTQFLNELASEMPQKSLAEKDKIMISELTTTLKELYTKNHALLIKCLNENPICKGSTSIRLIDILQELKIDRDDSSIFVLAQLKKLYHRHNFKDQARNIIREAFVDIDQEFDNLSRKETEYNRSQFSAVMKKLITKIKSRTDDNHCFTLTPKLEISIAVRVARHSFFKFQNMNRNYEKKYGLSARLEEIRGQVYQMFLNKCEKQAEEIIATNIFCDELKKSIEERLQRNLQLKMYREIVQKFNCQKHHLMKTIMEDLAIIDDFNVFIEYIQNPEVYVQKWLKIITDKVIFKANDSNRSSYTTWLEVIIPDIIEKIKSSAKLTTELPHTNLYDWMECFKNQIDSASLALILNKTSFQLLFDLEIKNFDGFLSSIFKKLSELETQLINTWTEREPFHFTWSDETPYDLIYNFLWGCSSKCPWCYEPCQKSDRWHESKTDCHYCIQHRPSGVGGIASKATGKLVLRTCNFSVQSTFELECGKWCGCSNKKCAKYHPYRSYKTHMKEWDISPLADMSNSKYWNWFMSKYSQQLSDYYGHNQPEIPISWKCLSKDVAIRSLSEVYGIT